MTKNPADMKPTTSFGEVMRTAGPPENLAGGAEPLLADAKCFQFSLFFQGVRLGWLGKDDSGWAILVTDPKQVLTLEFYPYNGVNYYRIKGSGSYMSVSSHSYVGFYNWAFATGYTVQGTNLVSEYNGQKLSFHSKEDGYLYAWNAYNVLDVKLEPVLNPVILNQPLTALIEHVVVLMLENRSFDNMLGGLYPTKTQAEYRGLNDLSEQDKSNPIDLSDPSKGCVAVFQGPLDYPTWIMPYPDPGELFDDMNEQIFGNSTTDATMKGFASNYGRQPGVPLQKGGPKVMPVPANIMQYYRQDAVPMTRSHFKTLYKGLDLR
jgi:Phosphoesterase family